MIDSNPDLYTLALAEYERSFSGDGAPPPFAGQRRLARDTFEALGVPTKRLEAWKYTDVSRAIPTGARFAGPGEARVSEADVHARAIESLDGRTVVTVNGSFRPELSDLDGLGEIAVMSLREAMDAHGPVFREHYGRYADVQGSAFVALNAAFDLEGVFIHVPDGTTLQRPLRILHLVDVETEAVVQSRSLYVFGRNSRASLIESHESRSTPPKTFGNHLTEMIVGPDAVIDHCRIQREGGTASQVNTTQVQQRDRSVFSTTTFTFESALVRNDLNVVADGEGCESNLGGLYIARGDQHVDNHTLMDHARPGCASSELYKGIIYDRATGVFNGKVLVRRDAQRTNAYQQSQGVVLSDEADHYSKPELEIYADDVKCSHGSTTGEIDPEALFYCRARGISLDDARSLLLYAFAHDVVEQVKIEPLRTWLDARIGEQLD